MDRGGKGRGGIKGIKGRERGGGDNREEGGGERRK